MENSDFFQPQKRSKRPLIIASAFVGVLFLFVVVMSLFSDKNQIPGQQTTPTNNQTTQNDNEIEPGQTSYPSGVAVNATAPPLVDFYSWSEAPQPAFSPASSSVYQLKQNFSFEEVKSIATKLNTAGTVKQQNSAVLAFDLSQDNKQASMLTFDTVNGRFSYTSIQGVPLPKKQAPDFSTEEKVYQFLRDLGLYDATMKVTAQYKKRSVPGVTYVEIHRDWQAAGLPIVNSIGLLNLPENQSLNTLALSTNVQNMTEDTDIIQTTDRKDGKARQNDFNTITLTLADKTDSVTGIKSNIRFLQTAAPQTQPLLSFDEAVSKLKSKQYDLLLTSPAGGGDAPWESVYPGNKATAQNATILESYVAYIEKPAGSSQRELMPYYIFRGTATLDSGYKVKYIGTVPATATKTQGSLFGVKSVLAQEDNTQKQSTFEPNTTPGAASNVTSGFPPSINLPEEPTRDDTGACVPSINDLNPVYNIGGLKYGWSPFRVYQGKRSTNKDGFWHYIPEPGQTTTILQNNLDLILNTIRALSTSTAVDQTGLTVTEPPVEDLPETPDGDTAQKQGSFNITQKQTDSGTPMETDLEVRKENKVIKDLQTINDYCPVRVTGASPSLFIYDNPSVDYQVNLGAELTYADPATEGNNWNKITPTNGKLIVNNKIRDYLYYEYVPVAFTRPQTGWLVSKQNLNQFAESVIAKNLGLNSNETQRLVFELKHAANSVQNENLFVGTVSSQQLEEKLPLVVSPKPARTYRFHFYVTGDDGTPVHSPILTPVMRSGSMAIELGAYGK